ncbi:ethanolamine-phosphate cytidylyltransferase [Anaeramoeba flamelloides]|uniref:ethanolamine-phosphate cytidylyltransferase n=1 Tax=Anaeramoeba flamelloides TaxID=1746091 RepID=A0AAV7ZM08_9EUKA|nr:ethanolamine-phosphate cytidylyltransferase [Anaeramoeba flamelloides]
MSENKKSIRLWVDGVFDLCHWAHMNLFRQARQLGDYLVVGVHSCEDIKKHKGPPVLNYEERYEAVRGCKWVDEVVEGAPYITDPELVKKYNCDYVVHGSDATFSITEGDPYKKIKELGLYRTVPRTNGVSTTEIIGRFLLMDLKHLNREKNPIENVGIKEIGKMTQGSTEKEQTTLVSHYLPTTRRIVQFSDGKEPKGEEKVVYVDGVFDLFHAGHISFLKKAKEHGDYVLVGIHDDIVANKQRGTNFPIMNLHERVLCVLGCRYVDEVIIGAPFNVTKKMIEDMNISKVLHGTTELRIPKDAPNPYKVPKDLGIYEEIESVEKFNYMSERQICMRVLENRLIFDKRNKFRSDREENETENEKNENN